MLHSEIVNKMYDFMNFNMDIRVHDNSNKILGAGDKYCLYAILNDCVLFSRPNNKNNLNIFRLLNDDIISIDSHTDNSSEPVFWCKFLDGYAPVELLYDINRNTGEVIIHDDLRIIQRRKSDTEWERIRMVDIKKGDEFKIFEPDMTYVGSFYASSDGYINRDGVGTVECECTQTESK